jgi:hypothetical protein
VRFFLSNADVTEAIACWLTAKGHIKGNGQLLVQSQQTYTGAIVGFDVAFHPDPEQPKTALPSPECKRG